MLDIDSINSEQDYIVYYILSKSNVSYLEIKYSLRGMGPL